MLMLTASPLAANGEVVGYEDAIECSALFTYISALNDEGPDQDLIDLSAKWLVLAMDRDGTSDGSRAEEELGPRVELLAEEIEDMGENDDIIQQMLFGRIEYCEAIHEEVADEFDELEGL